MMIFGFLLFLGLFALIGISSVLHSRGTKKDYYLASSSIPPSLVGLSAVATNNSADTCLSASLGIPMSPDWLPSG